MWSYCEFKARYHKDGKRKRLDTVEDEFETERRFTREIQFRTSGCTGGGLPSRYALELVEIMELVSHRLRTRQEIAAHIVAKRARLATQPVREP